jgi:hypothetical protein
VKTGTRPEIADKPGAGSMTPPASRSCTRSSRTHAGKTVEEVKPRFEELIKDVEATEIAAMEQKLIEGGVPDTEVKRLCDVHVQVFADALEGHEPVKVPAGHPIDTFQRENQALLQVTASLRKVAEKIGEPPVRTRNGSASSPPSRRVDRLPRSTALPAQGEPALPGPRGQGRLGAEQGHVVDPRRHPRADEAGARRSPTTTRRWP